MYADSVVIFVFNVARAEVTLSIGNLTKFDPIDFMILPEKCCLHFLFLLIPTFLETISSTEAFAAATISIP